MTLRLFTTKLYLLHSLLGLKSPKIKQSDFDNPKHNNLKTKIYRTIILPVFFLYGCEA